MVHNRDALRDFMACNEGDNCERNQDKSTSRMLSSLHLHMLNLPPKSVIIFSAYEFRTAWDGKTGGEEIWAAAVVSGPARCMYSIQWLK